MCLFSFTLKRPKEVITITSGGELFHIFGPRTLNATNKEIISRNIIDKISDHMPNFVGCVRL